MSGAWKERLLRPALFGRRLLWEFVGGKAEPGGTKEQTLFRECREELGVMLSAGEVFMDVVHTYPDIVAHLTLFSTVIQAGVPQKLEHNDIRWITPREIPQYDFCRQTRISCKGCKAVWPEYRKRGVLCRIDRRRTPLYEKR